jgi:hypothetical protein
MRKSILGKYHGCFYAKGAIRAKEGDQGSHQALYRVHHAGPLLGRVVQALFNLVGPLDESFGMTPYICEKTLTPEEQSFLQIRASSP